MFNSIGVFVQLMASIGALIVIRFFLLSPTLDYRSNEPFLFIGVASKLSAAGFNYEIKTIKLLLGLGAGVCFVFGLIVSMQMAFVLPIISIISFALFVEVRARKNSKVQLCNDEICFLIARCLRAGNSIDQSLKVAFENHNNSQSIGYLVHQMSFGVHIKRAARDLFNQQEDFSSVEKMLCATIVLAHEMGGSAARIFDRMGDSFHQNYELKKETQSAISQVKASTVVIGALPIVMFCLSLILGSDATLFLFTKPLGVTFLVAGLSLEICGVIWMNKLVKNGVGIWTS